MRSPVGSRPFQEQVPHHVALVFENAEARFHERSVIRIALLYARKRKAQFVAAVVVGREAVAAVLDGILSVRFKPRAARRPAGNIRRIVQVRSPAVASSSHALHTREGPALVERGVGTGRIAGSGIVAAAPDIAEAIDRSLVQPFAHELVAVAVQPLRAVVPHKGLCFPLLPSGAAVADVEIDDFVTRRIANVARKVVVQKGVPLRVGGIEIERALADLVDEPVRKVGDGRIIISAYNRGRFPVSARGQREKHCREQNGKDPFSNLIHVVPPTVL